MYSDTETKWLSEEPVEAADTDLEEIESDLEAPLLAEQEPQNEPEAKLEEGPGPHDPVLAYLREIGSVALLTREREVELGKQMQICRNQILEALFSTPMTLRHVLELGVASLAANWSSGRSSRGPKETRRKGKKRSIRSPFSRQSLNFVDSAPIEKSCAGS